jgi:exosortase A
MVFFFPFGFRRAGRQAAMERPDGRANEGAPVEGANNSGPRSVVKTEAQLIGDNAPAGSAVRAVPALAAAFVSLGVLALYWQTAASIVAIWLRSETFAHGFIIIPICLWLVWRRRDVLARIPADPWWPALIGVFLSGALWLVASAADALGVKQFALAFMLQAAIITVVGRKLTRELLFPLAFLLFAVPAGEIFVPTLIEWTADFTVNALRWSGVPVYREANYFIIPSGSWSVVEACSGIRYIIASVMVGTIYAAVAYRSTKRRVAFLTASILVPIVANWLRAYMIVMIAHLTNNTFAVGVDHIIYGWVFFGIVMLLLFWVGSFWSETEPALQPGAAAQARLGGAGAPGSDVRRLFAAALAAIAIAGLWLPIESIVARPATIDVPLLRPLAGENGWVYSETSPSAWKPHYVGYASELDQTFVKGGHKVGLYVAYFRNQEKGRELITSGNGLVTMQDLRWRQLTTRSENIEWADAQVEVHRAEIAETNARLVAYRLYWVNGTVTSSDYVGKALIAWSKLRGRGDDSALIVIYTLWPAAGTDVDAALRDFATAMSPSIVRLLYSTRSGWK